MRYEKHKEFVEPDDEAIVWRYMSLAKFLALLANRGLYFTRIDKLEDRFEGTLPSVTFRKLDPWLRRGYLDMRTISLVNCWSCQPHESAVLWQSYGREGVAIQSTFRRLVSSFEQRGILTHNTVHGGLVQYVDFETHYLCNVENTAFNAFLPLLHKRLSYRDERELRLIIWPTDHFWSQAIHVLSGWSVFVDLPRLIEAVRIAPGSPEWMQGTVASCVSAFGLNPDIVQSSALDEEPSDQR